MAGSKAGAPPGSEADRQRLVWVALALLCLGMCRVILTRGDFISDDAWISMRYAANLVDGHGLTWNPGQPPVEGYSNLLWTLLGAVGIALGLPLPGWLTALGLACSAGAVLVTYAIVRDLGGGAGWGLFAAALTATSSVVGAVAILGLEPPSLVLLMTLGTWRALVEEREIRAGRPAPPWSALWFGLLTLAHVEGPFYLGIPLLIRLSRLLAPPAVAPDRRRDWIMLAILLAFPLGQELLRIVYYGDWLPNTIRIKVLARGEKASMIFGLRYVLLSLVCNRAVTALVLIGASAALILRRGAGGEDRLAAGALLLPWLACAGFSIAANGDMINQFRFMAPGVPTLLALSVLGWAELIRRAPGPLRLGAVVVPLGLGTAGAYRDLSIQVVSHNRASYHGEETGLAALKIDWSRPFGSVNELPNPISRLWSPSQGWPVESVPWFVAWVLENVPVGQAVMFPDVGLMGLVLGDGMVLDARGLNSRGPARLLAASPVDGPEGMSDPGVIAFLDEFRQIDPACLVLQARDGRIWGPPEAALQGAGALDRYRGVATGSYVNGQSVRVYTADRPGPTREQVLARYRRAEALLPGVFDWSSRLKGLEEGWAQPAETPWMGGGDVELYPAGAWSTAASGKMISAR